MCHHQELEKVANNHYMRLRDFLKYLEQPDRIKKGSAKRKWKKERAK